MKLGVLQFFSWPERRVPLETVFARALERIEIMDRAGYDAVWLAEHHFSSFSVCPSVHLMGTMAAARTKRLRIGTGVSLAPFYHPLRLAEEVALLDVLSGGRVNWGAGRGFARVEFEDFGVPPDESTSRFHEAVEIVLRAWTEERLELRGQRISGSTTSRCCRSRCSSPHPPVWMAATSEGSIDWAAGRGFSILMDPHSAHADLGRKRRYYAEKLAAAGFSIEGRDMPMARLLALGDSAGGGRGGRAARRRMDRQLVFRRAAPVGIKDPTAPGADPVQRYLDGVILHGTAESVLDQILRLREEIGLDYLLAAPLSHRSFMLLTEKILPRLP